MGIETMVAESNMGGGSNFGNSNSAFKVSKPKKTRRKVKKAAEVVIKPVQKLFDTCKEVFVNSSSGVVPCPEDIERLRLILDEIKPQDVGLGPKMQCLRVVGGQGTPTITYFRIYECANFSIGIFCLPPSGVIPLHNHPGMTVFSKLLFGTMHIKSYDWAVDSPLQHPEVRLAEVKVDSDLTAPCNTSILYPADGGNMHRFTAVTACAVLDVLGPPYCDADGRHCTYYFDYPFDNFSADGVTIGDEERKRYAWLQEREEKPEDVEVVGAPYRGPKIVEN